MEDLVDRREQFLVLPFKATRSQPLAGGSMTKRTPQENLLDGIEANIHATQKQIYQLKINFALLTTNGQASERRLMRQQLHILHDNLELLKDRRIYALESTH